MDFIKFNSNTKAFEIKDIKIPVLIIIEKQLS